jgi:DNA invertase Pin-like site-specific DNA recombinase
MSWNKGKTKINWNLEKDNIKKLLDAGKTFKEIADEYKVSPSAIWRGLKSSWRGII